MLDVRGTPVLAAEKVTPGYWLDRIVLTAKSSKWISVEPGTAFNHAVSLLNVLTAAPTLAGPQAKHNDTMPASSELSAAPSRTIGTPLGVSQRGRLVEQPQRSLKKLRVL